MKLSSMMVATTKCFLEDNILQNMSRGFALLSQPIDSLYDTVLKSCNDLDVSSLNEDKNNYKIGGKKGARFVINMLEMTSGTLLEAIHYKKYDLDTFLIPLFKNLAKYIPLEWGFRVHQLDLTSDGKLLEESKLSYKGYQFHQLEILYDGTRIILTLKNGTRKRVRYAHVCLQTHRSRIFCK